MPYRILYSSAAEEWGGGAEARLIDVVTGMDPAEFEPAVVTSSADIMAPRFRALGVPTTVVPVTYFVRRPPFVDYYWRGPRAFRRLMRAGPVDLVHVTDNRPIEPLVRAARPLGVPVVVHVVDMDRPWFKARNRGAFEHVAAVIAISNAVRDYCLRHGVDAAKIRVIYRGVNEGPFREARSRRAATRRALGLRDDEVVAGVFARLHDRKGHHELLPALADPVLANVPLRVLVVGGDDGKPDGYGARMRAMAAELGLADRVTFLGYREDVPDLIAACDLALAPFRREAFGAVILESLLAGVPQIAYRDGAFPEILGDSGAGVLVEAGDAPSFAAELRRLALDPALRARMAEAALRRAGAFTQERHLAQTAALYRELIAAARARGSASG